MPRPSTITNEQILTAARRLFLAQGFGVSTSQIAQVAGVSEGTIFKRFLTKAQLFQASMGLPEIPQDKDHLFEAGTLEVREQFHAVGLELLTYLRALMPRVMMMWAQPNINPVTFLKENDVVPPKILLQKVVHYIESEKKMGRIQCESTMTVARMFLGSIHNFIFFELITGSNRTDEEVQSFLNEMLSVLWQGIKHEN
jgi:AcrR family transcriptional regulator